MNNRICKHTNYTLYQKYIIYFKAFCKNFSKETVNVLVSAATCYENNFLSFYTNKIKIKRKKIKNGNQNIYISTGFTIQKHASSIHFEFFCFIL